MADDKPGSSEAKAAFMFVRHGDPLPTAWMAAHPGWVKFPATLVTRPAGATGRARPDGVQSSGYEAEPGSLEGGTARPVAMGVPMVQRPGLRNRGRPPRYPGRFGADDDQGGSEDPIAAYLRVNGSLAEMGLVEPVAAWGGKDPHRAHTAENAVTPPTVPAAALPNVNAGLHVSTEGAEFIFQRETQGHLDRTQHPYWPGRRSGVTLGPGYDFGYRLREQIVEDLISIGVDPATAQTLSAAGEGKDKKGKPLRDGLYGPAADEFAKQHAGDVALTESQQRLLFSRTLPTYEADVRRLVHVPLSQSEFDALVSFDFSRGPGNLEQVALLLDSGRRSEAISLPRHFDDDLGAGYAIRRQAEANRMLHSNQSSTGTTGNGP